VTERWVAGAQANITGVSRWKDSLSRGLLPDDDTEWPDQVFRDGLLETLKELDMARFTRKVPAPACLPPCLTRVAQSTGCTHSHAAWLVSTQHAPVTNTLMRNILEMLQEYEEQLANAPPDEGCVPSLPPPHWLSTPTAQSPVRLATVEQQCHHHAPLSALLLSAVHPVALCTHTHSRSQAPPHCKQGAVCTAHTLRWWCLLQRR
jgi:hypothetical protein